MTRNEPNTLNPASPYKFKIYQRRTHRGILILNKATRNLRSTHYSCEQKYSNTDGLEKI